LLGAVRHEDGFDAFNPYQIQVDTGWHGEVVNVHTFHFNHMTNTIANPENGEGREGFVVVIQNESGPADRIKMKFAKYVQLHSLMSGLTNKRVWQLMRDGTMDDYIGQFPDEMHKAIQGYAMELVRELTRIMSESGLIHDEVRLLPTRREQAEFINKNVENREYRPLVFAFLDGDLDKVRSIAYKIMEPDQSIPLMQQ
jgi:RNA ligase